MLPPFLVHQLFDVAQELPHSHMHNTTPKSQQKENTTYNNDDKEMKHSRHIEKIDTQTILLN